MIAIGVLITFATVRLTEGGNSHAGWTSGRGEKSRVDLLIV